jgi:GAF domain-containing protein
LGKKLAGHLSVALAKFIAEEEIINHDKLLDSINQIFQESLAYDTENDVIEKCLEVAVKLTESEFGFFGEVNENGRLGDRVLSPPAWYVCETPNAHELLRNMEIRSYWGRTITEEKSQIVNQPDSDLDRRGLPDGHPPIISFLGVPLKEGKKTIGMIALANKESGYTEEDKSNVETLSAAFVEVLMRKRAEIEIKENLKDLAQSNKELEQFAYITSHDLREPLRMITSFLQLLERRYKDNLDQDANDFIGYAVNGAKRLDAMTNDLLQYSKITSEKREIKPVNFEHVLEEALINLKVPIEETNAVITHMPYIRIRSVRCILHLQYIKKII